MTTGKSRRGKPRRPRAAGAAQKAAAASAGMGTTASAGMGAAQEGAVQPGTVRKAPKMPRPRVPIEPKRRFRSKHIAYGVVGALVLCCGGNVIYDALRPKRCVGPAGTVVEDSNCRNGVGGARWYYGGSGGRTPGSAVSGGSFERGGFGGRVFGGSS